MATQKLRQNLRFSHMGRARYERTAALSYIWGSSEFNIKASDKEIIELSKAVTHVANLMGSKDKGYRTLTNIGSDGGQEVAHLHFHIFAGEKIGKMVS